MAFSYDLSTDVGRVRLSIPDRDAANAVFSDEEVEAFLFLEDGIKRAAAAAIETIATDQALLLKVVERLDVKTDGAKVSDALLKRAKLLRDQADAGDLAADEAVFDVAEMADTSFAVEERLYKQMLLGL